MGINFATHENVRRIVYGYEGATFIPVCTVCKRFVKADRTITFHLAEYEDTILELKRRLDELRREIAEKDVAFAQALCELKGLVE